MNLQSSTRECSHGLSYQDREALSSNQSTNKIIKSTVDNNNEMDYGSSIASDEISGCHGSMDSVNCRSAIEQGCVSDVTDVDASGRCLHGKRGRKVRLSDSHVVAFDLISPLTRQSAIPSNETVDKMDVILSAITKMKVPTRCEAGVTAELLQDVQSVGLQPFPIQETDPRSWNRIQPDLVLSIQSGIDASDLQMSMIDIEIDPHKMGKLDTDSHNCQTSSTELRNCETPTIDPENFETSFIDPVNCEISSIDPHNCEASLIDLENCETAFIDPHSCENEHNNIEEVIDIQLEEISSHGDGAYTGCPTAMQSRDSCEQPTGNGKAVDKAGDSYPCLHSSSDHELGSVHIRSEALSQFEESAISERIEGLESSVDSYQLKGTVTMEPERIYESLSGEIVDPADRDLINSEDTGEHTGEHTCEHTGEHTGDHTSEDTGEHTSKNTGEHTGEHIGERLSIENSNIEKVINTQLDLIRRCLKDGDVENPDCGNSFAGKFSGGEKQGRPGEVLAISSKDSVEAVCLRICSRQESVTGETFPTNNGMMECEGKHSDGSNADETVRKTEKSSSEASYLKNLIQRALSIVKVGMDVGKIKEKSEIKSGMQVIKMEECRNDGADCEQEMSMTTDGLLMNEKQELSNDSKIEGPNLASIDPSGFTVEQVIGDEKGGEDMQCRGNVLTDDVINDLDNCIRSNVGTNDGIRENVESDDVIRGNANTPDVVSANHKIIDKLNAGDVINEKVNTSESIIEQFRGDNDVIKGVDIDNGSRENVKTNDVIRDNVNADDDSTESVNTDDDIGESIRESGNVDDIPREWVCAEEGLETNTGIVDAVKEDLRPIYDDLSIGVADDVIGDLSSVDVEGLEVNIGILDNVPKDLSPVVDEGLEVITEVVDDVTGDLNPVVDEGLKENIEIVDDVKEDLSPIDDEGLGENNGIVDYLKEDLIPVDDDGLEVSIGILGDVKEDLSPVDDEGLRGNIGILDDVKEDLSPVDDEGLGENIGIFDDVKKDLSPVDDEGLRGNNGIGDDVREDLNPVDDEGLEVSIGILDDVREDLSPVDDVGLEENIGILDGVKEDLSPVDDEELGENIGIFDDVKEDLSPVDDEGLGENIGILDDVKENLSPVDDKGLEVSIGILDDVKEDLSPVDDEELEVNIGILDDVRRDLSPVDDEGLGENIGIVDDVGSTVGNELFENETYKTDVDDERNVDWNELTGENVRNPDPAITDFKYNEDKRKHVEINDDVGIIANAAEDVIDDIRNVEYETRDTNSYDKSVNIPFCDFIGDNWDNANEIIKDDVTGDVTNLGSIDDNRNPDDVSRNNDITGYVPNPESINCTKNHDDEIRNDDITSDVPHSESIDDTKNHDDEIRNDDVTYDVTISESIDIKNHGDEIRNNDVTGDVTNSESINDTKNHDDEIRNDDVTKDVTNSESIDTKNHGDEIRNDDVTGDVTNSESINDTKNHDDEIRNDDVTGDFTNSKSIDDTKKHDDEIRNDDVTSDVPHSDSIDDTINPRNDDVTGNISNADKPDDNKAANIDEKYSDRVEHPKEPGTMDTRNAGRGRFLPGGKKRARNIVEDYAYTKEKNKDGLFFDATFADLVLGDDVTFDDDIDSCEVHVNSEMMLGECEAMENSMRQEKTEELERSHPDPNSFYEHLDRRMRDEIENINDPQRALLISSVPVDPVPVDPRSNVTAYPVEVHPGPDDLYSTDRNDVAPCLTDSRLTKSDSDDPYSTDLHSVDPHPADPHSADPISADPHSAESPPADPHYSDSHSLDPNSEYLILNNSHHADVANSADQQTQPANRQPVDHNPDADLRETLNIDNKIDRPIQHGGELNSIECLREGHFESLLDGELGENMTLEHPCSSVTKMLRENQTNLLPTILEHSTSKELTDHTQCDREPCLVIDSSQSEPAAGRLDQGGVDSNNSLPTVKEVARGTEDRVLLVADIENLRRDRDEVRTMITRVDFTSVNVQLKRIEARLDSRFKRTERLLKTFIDSHPELF